METKILLAYIKYLPAIIFFSAAIIIIGSYVYNKFSKQQAPLNTRLLRISAWLLIVFRAFYSLTLSALQYFTWKNDTGIGQYFLPPHRDIGYFLQYSWTHFIFGMVLSAIAAFVFYFILRAVKKHREAIFEEGELELGLTCALIVGWPSVILFVALAFLLLLVFSVFNQLFLKDKLTTITLPLLVALLIILILGNKIIEILNLTALKM